MLNDLRFRFRALFRRGSLEEELNQELHFHFEQQVEKYTRAGMPSEEARRRTRLTFGGHEQVKEDCREAHGTSLIDAVSQDVRYALRVQRKSLSFFIVATLTLALGIGSSTAVFSLVNAILLKSSPYPNASRIVVPWLVAPAASAWGTDTFQWMGLQFVQLTQTSGAFQHLGAFRKADFNLTGMANPEHLTGIRASAGFFPALGMAPLLGRTFTADDDQPGHELVAVLSHRLWTSRFGGDPGIIGRIVHLNGVPYTVIGVMPAVFTFPNLAGLPASSDLPKETLLWVPLALPAAPAPSPNDLSLIGELKPGAGLPEVRQDLQAFDRQWLKEFPRAKGWSSRAVPLTQQTVTDTRRPLLLLFGAVCVVLLIACSNVAGLTLNRSLGRRNEFALRGALGAKRGRLVGQLMIESLLLALTGGILGIGFAEASLLLARRIGPDTVPHIHEVGLDLRVVAFALGITLLTGLLFGLAPAFGATRVNLVQVLKEGGRRSGGNTSAPRIRNALLITQVALALVLVVSAGLLMRTFYHLVTAQSGFDATRVVTFDLPLSSSKYSDTGRMAQIYKQVQQRLQAISGVESAGFATVVPLAGPSDATAIRIPEHPVIDPSLSPQANYLFVSPDYFRTIGATLQRGRDITDSDTLASVPVTLINSAMARKYWPGEDPVGKHVGVGMTRIPLRTIIGIVPDFKQVSLREAPAPAMYVPYTQNEIKSWPDMQTMQYAVRVKGDPAAIAGSVQQAVHSIDPDLPVANYVTLTKLVDSSLTADRFAMLLLGAFGLVALLLASVGMYGVISFAVIQRTPEIGIRIALGAQRAQILAIVLSQGARLACIGIALGLFGAFTATRLMTALLYGIQPTDPVTFGVAALLLILVALAACYVPARKAMQVDPIIALRYE
ncbi:MAG: ABC transporter permease [Terracidiphilus sp.]